MPSPPPSPESERVRAEVAEFAHGRVPRELRLRHVVALAYELFAERGFTGASMDELARRAGVSKPVIYDLVGSKEDLFAVVMKEQIAALAGAIESAVTREHTDPEKLYAGALAFFRFVDTHRQAWRTILTADAAPVSAVIASARRSQANLIAGLLASSVTEAGVAIDPVLQEACAHAINGAFEALAMYALEHPELQVELLAALATGLVQPGLESFRNGLQLHTQPT